MIYTNNNTSVLPFYDSVNQQNSNKWYAYGRIYPLICHKKYLLPFQLVVPLDVKNITLIELTSESDNNIVYDLTDILIDNGLKIIEFPELGYNVIMYNGIKSIDVDVPIGRYYILIGDGSRSYFSDILTLSDSVENCTMLEWWCHENQYFTGGCTVYDGLFKYKLYIPYSIGKPEYEFQEEGQERDGLFFPELRVSLKKYNTRLLAPEYLTDALRTAQLADYIRITSEGIRYMCDTLQLTVNWQTDGDLANVKIEFTTDTVIKSIGKALEPYNEDHIIFDRNLIFSNVKSSKTVNLYSNIAYQLVPSTLPAYLDITPKSGSGDTTVTVEVIPFKYTGRLDRSAVITYEGVNKEDITGDLLVTQKGDIELYFSPDNINIGSGEQTTTLSLFSNLAELSVSATIRIGDGSEIPISDLSKFITSYVLMPDGVPIDITKPIPNDPGRTMLYRLELTCAIPKNSNTENVYYKIIATGGGKTAEGKIEQLGKYIRVNPTEYLNGTIEPQTVTTLLTASDNWEYIPIPAFDKYFTLNQKSGSAGNTTLEMTVTENYANNYRYAHANFALSDEKTIKALFSVRQNYKLRMDFDPAYQRKEWQANTFVQKLIGNLHGVILRGTYRFEDEETPTPIADIKTVVTKVLTSGNNPIEDDGRVPGNPGGEGLYELFATIVLPENNDVRAKIWDIEVYVQKNAHLTIKQYGKQTLTVTPPSFIAPVEGNEQIVTVECTSSWQLKQDQPDYLHVNPKLGDAGSTSVRFNSDRNGGRTRRTNIVSFISDVDATAIGEVVANQRSVTDIAFQPESGYIPADGVTSVRDVFGNLKSVNFEGTFEIEGTGIKNPIEDIFTLIKKVVLMPDNIEIGRDGIIPGDPGAYKTYHLEVSMLFPKNEDTRAILWHLVVFDDSNENYLELRQPGSAGKVQLIPADVTIPSSGGNVDIQIISNDTWTISNVPDYINVSKLTGFGDDTVRFSILDTPTEDRYANIIVRGATGGLALLKITQLV